MLRYFLHLRLYILKVKDNFQNDKALYSGFYISIRYMRFFTNQVVLLLVSLHQDVK